MPRPRKRIALILLLVLLAAAGYLALRRAQPTRDGDLSFSGNIELAESRIAFKVSGRLAELHVREGDFVRQGAVLARLDQEQPQRIVERARAALAQAVSQVQQLQTAIDFQRETYLGQVEQRKAEVQVAQSRLRDLQAGSRPQELEQARSAVSRAKAESETARADWERAQALYRSEDISRAQYDQSRSRNEAASAALRQAEEQLSLVMEGARKEQVETARADLARAEAALRLAESLRLEVTRREQERAARQADVDRGKAELALAESQWRDTVAVAPSDGVVLVKSAEVGEILAPGATVVTLGDMDHPWMRGYIAESDLGRVKQGDKVRVTTDSFPGKAYWGTVSFLASEAEFTPKQIQTPEERVKLVYRLKVDIPNPDRELKANMPVDAQIVIDAPR